MSLNNQYFSIVPNNKLDSVDCANAYLDGVMETLSNLIMNEEHSEISKTLYLSVLNLQTVKAMIENLSTNEDSKMVTNSTQKPVNTTDKPKPSNVNVHITKPVKVNDIHRVK